MPATMAGNHYVVAVPEPSAGHFSTVYFLALKDNTTIFLQTADGNNLTVANHTFSISVCFFYALLLSFSKAEFFHCYDTLLHEVITIGKNLDFSFKKNFS